MGGCWKEMRDETDGGKGTHARIIQVRNQLILLCINTVGRGLHLQFFNATYILAEDLALEVFAYYGTCGKNDPSPLLFSVLPYLPHQELLSSMTRSSRGQSVARAGKPNTIYVHIYIYILLYRLTLQMLV